MGPFHFLWIMARICQMLLMPSLMVCHGNPSQLVLSRGTEAAMASQWPSGVWRSKAWSGESNKSMFLCHSCYAVFAQEKLLKSERVRACPLVG